MKIVIFPDTAPLPVSHNPKIKKHVALSYKERAGITQLAQAIFPPGEIAPGHAHDDMLEIFIVQAGSGVIRIDNTAYDLGPNCCAIAEPGETHEIENTGTDNLVILVMGLETMP